MIIFSRGYFEVDVDVNVDVDNYVDVDLVLFLQQQANKSGGRPSLWKSVSSPRPIEEEDDR